MDDVTKEVRPAGGALEVLEALLASPASDARTLVLPAGVDRGAAVAALHDALRALQERDRARERRERLPANVGKPWTSAQDTDLLAAFDAGMPIDEIAVRLQRTRVGIRTRLERHGRLAPVPPAGADAPRTAAVEGR